MSVFNSPSIVINIFKHLILCSVLFQHNMVYHKVLAYYEYFRFLYFFYLRNYELRSTNLSKKLWFPLWIHFVTQLMNMRGILVLDMNGEWRIQYIYFIKYHSSHLKITLEGTNGKKWPVEVDCVSRFPSFLMFF